MLTKVIAVAERQSRLDTIRTEGFVQGGQNQGRYLVLPREYFLNFFPEVQIDSDRNSQPCATNSVTPASEPYPHLRSNFPRSPN